MYFIFISNNRVIPIQAENESPHAPLPSSRDAGFNPSHTAGKDTTVFSEADHKKVSPVISKINDILAEEFGEYPLSLKDGISHLMNLIHYPELLELAVKSIPAPPLSSAAQYHSSHEDHTIKNLPPSSESHTSVACLQEGLDTASLTLCTTSKLSNDVTTGLANRTHVPREKPSIAADRRVKDSALVMPTPWLPSHSLGVFSKDKGEEELVEEEGGMARRRMGRGGKEEEGRRGEFKRELERQQGREEKEEEEEEEEDSNELRLHSTAVQCSCATDVIAVPASTAASYSHTPPFVPSPITTIAVPPKKSKYMC